MLLSGYKTIYFYFDDYSSWKSVIQYLKILELDHDQSKKDLWYINVDLLTTSPRYSNCLDAPVHHLSFWIVISWLLFNFRVFKAALQKQYPDVFVNLQSAFEEILKMLKQPENAALLSTSPTSNLCFYI